VDPVERIFVVDPVERMAEEAVLLTLAHTAGPGHRGR